jgi:hypothetical protein
LEFLLNCSYNDERFKAIAYAAFNYFIRESITLIYEEKKIIIGNPNEGKVRFLDENNYFDFQNKIREGVKHNEKKNFSSCP